MRVYDIVHKLQDLTDLEWSESVQTSASGGSFLKARTGVGDEATYYKLSCYDAYRGIYGHESVNEIIAARLMKHFGVPCAEYRLLHAKVLVDDGEYETWLSSSKTFRALGEKKIAFDQFFDFHHEKGESQLELMERFGWREQFEDVMLADYLIANRDRHGANIEILRDKQGNFRLAPAFDNGVSLLFSCRNDAEIIDFDVMADVRANNYVGTRSLEENLKFVRTDTSRPSLSKDDREWLLAGLDGVISPCHQDAIWRMVYGRWCEYARIRDL